MADKVWKARERKIAGEFGAVRTPLSGGNSYHTRGDIIHSSLYMEVKGRQNHAAVKLYDQTKALARKEFKTPVVALWQHGRPGYLIVCAPEDLMEVAEAWERRS